MGSARVAPPAAPPVEETGALARGSLIDDRAMLLRYGVVSAFNIVGHQSILFTANSLLGWKGGWANALAASLVCGPAYLLSRNWVWQLEGDHDVRNHVVPFWILTVVGLLISTIFAAVAQASFGTGIAVNIAALAGYFLVWVAKFVLLDRLFRTTV